MAINSNRNQIALCKTYCKRIEISPKKRIKLFPLHRYFKKIVAGVGEKAWWVKVLAIEKSDPLNSQEGGKKPTAQLVS